MSTFKIIEAGFKDLEMFQTIYRETFLESFLPQCQEEDILHYMGQVYTTAVLESEFLNPESSHYFIVDEKENPFGVLKTNYGNAQTDLKDQGGFEIHRLYLLKSHYSQGFGQHLMDFAIGKAKEANFPFVWLGVWEHNPGAQKFYKRNGFEFCGSHQIYVGKDLQTDYLMRKEIL